MHTDEEITLANWQRAANDFPPGLIVVPCVDWVWTAFMVSLIKLVVPPGTMVKYVDGGHTIAQKRNSGALQVIEDHRWQWMLCLDSDMAPPPDTLIRLLAANKPVVSGLCFHRRAPFKMVQRQKGPDDTFPLMDVDSNDPIRPACFTGVASLLVRRAVLEAIPDPWFIADDQGVGEGWDFCEKVRAAGFELFCDTSVWVPHLGVTPIDLEYSTVYQLVAELFSGAEKPSWFRGPPPGAP